MVEKQSSSFKNFNKKNYDSGIFPFTNFYLTYIYNYTRVQTKIAKSIRFGYQPNNRKNISPLYNRVFVYCMFDLIYKSKIKR